jgi:hypothetical protein
VPPPEPLGWSSLKALLGRSRRPHAVGRQYQRRRQTARRPHSYQNGGGSVMRVRETSLRHSMPTPINPTVQVCGGQSFLAIGKPAHDHDLPPSFRPRTAARDVFLAKIAASDWFEHNRFSEEEHNSYLKAMEGNSPLNTIDAETVRRIETWTALSRKIDELDMGIPVHRAH